MTGPATEYALALLHSPLTSASAWGRLPALLRGQGFDVVVPEVTDDERPSYSGRYVAHSALHLRSQLGDRGCVLVGHSGAGPLLPQVAFARRAAGATVDGYVFVDAGLPRTMHTASRLDLMASEDPEFADWLRGHLEAGGRFPSWTDAELESQIPDHDGRAALLTGLRPRGLDYFTEELPLPEDWPDAPAAYVQLSASYSVPARTAQLRGWPVVHRDLGHFAALSQPEEVAAAIVEVLSVDE
jgi:pimeloyl-ACP methyl ester carboxylesterase